MKTIISGGKIITPERIIENHKILVDNEVISVIISEDMKIEADMCIDINGQYISPGFIDIHCHGGDGFDFMDSNDESFQSICRYHSRHGTTTLFPTTVSCSMDELIQFLVFFPKHSSVDIAIPGVHLEGPFLNPSKCGAQNKEYVIPIENNSCSKILEFSPYIKRWTIAPEIDYKYKFSNELLRKGILLSIGHTDMMYDDIFQAYSNGFQHMTHLYSGMNMTQHINGYRTAGAVEASYLIDGMSVELIADGKHLPIELIQLAYSIKGAEKTILITDAMRASGVNSKKSYLGSISDGILVDIYGGVAHLSDGSALAGSITNCEEMLRFVWKNSDIPLHDIIAMLSLSPAKLMKINHETGSLEIGKRADIVIFDEEANIVFVMANGMVIHKTF